MGMYLNDSKGECQKGRVVGLARDLVRACVLHVHNRRPRDGVGQARAHLIEGERAVAVDIHSLEHYAHVLREFVAIFQRRLEQVLG